MDGPRRVIKGLSSEQEEAIRYLIREENRKVRNTQGRGREGAVEHEEYPAPEVYIARVPVSGIPGLQEHLTYTGTGTGTGTGTTFGDDEPGHADCQIYQVVFDGSNLPRLKPVSGEIRRVYNLSTTDIAGRTWVKITRDKFETWIADPPGGEETLLPYLKVDSLTLDSDGNYPAKFSTWNPFTQAWTDSLNVKLHPPNGELLQLNLRYQGVLSGLNGAGEPVYVNDRTGIRIKENDGSPDYATINELRITGGSLTQPSSGVALLSVATGSITVEDADGTPSYSGTNTIQFDTTGLFYGISQPSSGVVQVDIPIEAGSWSPSATGVTNVGSISVSVQGHYLRVGNRVSCVCIVDVDVTSANTRTEFRVTLPVAAGLGNDDLLGVCTYLETLSTPTNGAGTITAQSIADEAQASFMSGTSTGTYSIVMSFMYKAN